MTAETARRAEAQAREQLKSIKAMVERLVHARECDGEGCELTDGELMDGLALVGTPDEEDRREYHDQDAAQERIQEDALSVEVRCDWHALSEEGKASEYLILLCTGGPAVRITGSLGLYGDAETAQLQGQDWFTPWTEILTTAGDDEALLTYARQFLA